MDNKLPEEYVVQKFYEFAGHAKHMRYKNEYRACCPVCFEGKSYGRKRRLNYVPNKNIIHCFNCTRTWNPLSWIIEVSGLSYTDILTEAESYNITRTIQIPKKVISSNELIIGDLPEDSINLFDKQQVSYYQSNKIVQRAILYIKERRLDTAINKPNSLYISLKDTVHKNRLVIPFYDENNKICWYQTRTLLEKDEEFRPKYMSKINAEKSVFGINKIDPNYDYIFICEGPIDSMFVKNGVAMAGIKMSEKQKDQISKFIFHKKIWILDNEMNTNKEVKDNMKYLLDIGERVFFWPDKFKDFKDLNSVCVALHKDNVNPTFFIDNSFEHDQGLKKML